MSHDSLTIEVQKRNPVLTPNRNSSPWKIIIQLQTFREKNESYKALPILVSNRILVIEQVNNKFAL